MANPYKILISGGGTGGHIYPALSIADELKRAYPDAEFLFVGAKDRMEMQKVPQAGYTIEGLNISGLQRSLDRRNLAFPFKLLDSLIRAKKIVKRFKPDIAIGTGGYASGPTLWAAQRAGIPTLIQEQNSYPGITNRLLAKRVEKICVAYGEMDRWFPKEKIVFTGNPIRADLLNVAELRDQAIAHYKLDPNRKTLLVLGGSLGARAINESVQSRLIDLVKNEIQILWQCGRNYYDEVKKASSEFDFVHVHPFLERMDLAYAAADVVLSRAGASTVSELCVVQKPALLLPSPNVAEDHQTRNAKALEKVGGAIVRSENELGNSILINVGGLLRDEDRLNRMKAGLKTLAKPNATKEIVSEIKKMMES
jgi:UDP-N-acetylglucosamine--N-acetylmuramyl-(pentapeptide) pyrophosphoryl-undecaprenol N-acetylglucosamine transferase